MGAGSRNESGGWVDLRNAIVWLPEDASAAERKAAQMLRDEVAKRARILLPITTKMAGKHHYIVVCSLDKIPPQFKPLLNQRMNPMTNIEGFAILSTQTQDNTFAFFACGKSPRATLFAVGKLLRVLKMRRDFINAKSDINIVTEPHYPLRGHQLGYRPKTNSYDGWDINLWEQYIRDLVAYGCNAIELIPPRSDDEQDSPLFPLPPLTMMEKMSQLLSEYDLEVWVWYPMIDENYTDEKTREFALKEREEVFSALPRLDSLFVPGGDPGHTPPKVFMDFVAKQAELLWRYHPQAQIWVSPQGFTADWMKEFVAILKANPEWLTGIVFGPQVRIPLPQLRQLIPDRYPLRLYPDITHSRHCQFPVPNWDMAFAFTEGRECINPRPRQMTKIARSLLPFTIGFITYSEGCNDDVNKIIWSALGWNPQTEPEEILRDYSRYFIGEEFEEAFAQGLLALERNWEGPLLVNSQVRTTLLQFQEMERKAPPQVRLNWRFQMALYRAYYDAYIQARLRYEKHLEEKALEELRAASQIGSLLAIERAEAILDEAVIKPVCSDWRARIFELAEALFQSIKMQLSVKRYFAIGVERGANLDTLEFPLNNRIWLKSQFAQIRSIPDEQERLERLGQILNWTNPGLGGFYIDMGSPESLSLIVGGKDFDEDPELRETPHVGFAFHLAGPTSWWTHLETLYDNPLRIRLSGLDPKARYRLRVVYGGDRAIKIRLVANEEFEIHPFIEKPRPLKPLEFDIPPEATKEGILMLTWYPEPGLGGNGRGCQVSEIWLMRKGEAE
ncbi:MAG: GH36 C-terminal domain-containing protein [Armatimonadetes bacterium]|nr:GH36 C-terminal domain-containing protein [Armatimonadota bacterium]